MISKFAKFKFIIPFALLSWIIVTYSVAFISSYTHKLYDTPHFERSSHGDIYNQSKDYLEFKITEVSDGNFYGTVSLWIRNINTKLLYSKSNSINVLITGNSDGKIFPIPTWINFDKKGKVGDNILLQTSSPVEINTTGLSKFFPFEKYQIDIIPKIQFVFNNVNDAIELTPDSTSTFIKIDYSFSVTNASSSQSVDKQSYFIIERQMWYKFIVLFVMGILFIPLLIMLKADLASMNTDILAILISVATIRSYMLGITTKIYIIDYMLGLILLLMAIIILTKLIREELKITN